MKDEFQAKTIDAMNTKRFNRSVIIGGIFSAITAFTLWIFIPNHPRPVWTAFVASAVVFLAYSFAKVDAIGEVKRSDYGNEDDYWNEVKKISTNFDGTTFVTTCFVLFFVLLARMI